MNNKRIATLLVECQAFKDLDEPLIFTSGELGIYYINTEKLCMDSGKFADYGNDSVGMIKHCVNMTEKHPAFNEIIQIISDKVQRITEGERKVAISGGQRRDWVFSGPVAHRLGLPHISLYKQTGARDKIHVVHNGKLNENPDIEGMYVVHIVDLITIGSSCYRIEMGDSKKGVAKGWIPMLRNQGAKVDHLLAVVDRLQGGQEMLKGQNVKLHSFVSIDTDFLKTSRYPARALKYAKDPRKWNETYLRENGPMPLIDFFNPMNGKLDRAKKFITLYSDILKETGKYDEFVAEIKSRYKIKI